LQAKVEKADTERRICRANLQMIANAEMAYRVKTRAGFTSNLKLLDDMFEMNPTCPNGGSYSVVVEVPSNSFTVHCSVLSHDAGALQPAGFSFGVNTDYENLEALDRLTKKYPGGATCRANLATIGNFEFAHNVSHGGFTSDLSLLTEGSGKLPVCPEGGAYSVVVGVPKDSFTVHCSIKRHDAGIVEPRGYSPGRNTR
jgi:hypothetical protein